MLSLNKTKTLLSFVILMTAPFVSPPLNAAPLPVWDSAWTQFANDDGIVGPGGGGQAFDAEYLYYSLNGTQLSIGLQTGFDVVDGHQLYSGHDYYAGDLALSFDGISGYEFGVDFGFLTKDYYLNSVDTGSATGIDVAGIYKNVTWNTGVYVGHLSSNPFALDGGDIINDMMQMRKAITASFLLTWRVWESIFPIRLLWLHTGPCLVATMQSMAAPAFRSQSQVHCSSWP